MAQLKIMCALQIYTELYALYAQKLELNTLWRDATASQAAAYPTTLIKNTFDASCKTRM